MADKKTKNHFKGRVLNGRKNLMTFIHRPDGRIRDRDSYGNDPCPPRDKKHWDVYGRFLKSKEGKLYKRDNIKIRADGSFRIENVAAGSYSFQVFGAVLTRRDGSSDAILSLNHRFTVPVMSGGRTGEPLDLGMLKPRLRKLQEPVEEPLVGDLTYQELKEGISKLGVLGLLGEPTSHDSRLVGTGEPGNRMREWLVQKGAVETWCYSKPRFRQTLYVYFDKDDKLVATSIEIRED